MHERSSKKKRLRNIKRMLASTVPEAVDLSPLEEKKPRKNPAAVALGRLGGLKGGKARAEKLTPKRREDIAKKAAAARWKKGSAFTESQQQSEFGRNGEPEFNKFTIASRQIYLIDAFEWLRKAEKCSIHAVVTDPPYSLVEYTRKELKKRKDGNGGIWRIPPSFDGHQRSPLPRFTTLKESGKDEMRKFFSQFAELLLPVLTPGAHVFIASNPLVSYLVYESFISQGFEKRGEIIRVVKTLRGGDRPKNAHEEFENVSVMPRSCWEPWGLFRKPCEGRVQDNLRKWGTGGLRRISQEEPFKDLIIASPATKQERKLADHPSIKPQRLMRQLVRASLPLGRGVVLDPFMGSGSTIAAAQAEEIESIGLEINEEFFMMATKAIPKLAKFIVKENINGEKK